MACNQDLKTKRYTWTRLQPMFVHILTNTTKQEIRSVCNPNELPYVRTLGFNKAGHTYLHQHKKTLATPIITSMTRQMHPLLVREQRWRIRERFGGRRLISSESGRGGKSVFLLAARGSAIHATQLKNQEGSRSNSSPRR